MEASGKQQKIDGAQQSSRKSQFMYEVFLEVAEGIMISLQTLRGGSSWNRMEKGETKWKNNNL